MDPEVVDSKIPPLEVWKERYLIAVFQYISTRDKEHCNAAIKLAILLRRARLTGTLAPCEREKEVAKTFRTRLYGMVLKNQGAWSNFFVADIGLEYTSGIEMFKPISPFAGCMLLLTRDDKEQSISGEAKEFRSAFKSGHPVSLNLVHSQRFLPKGDRKGHYTLLVLRPCKPEGQ